MNLYANLASLKDSMNITASDTSSDDRLMDALEAVSRDIDVFTSQFFYSQNAVYYFDTGESCFQFFPTKPILTISEMVTDSELDNTYDGETWVEGTDFYTEAHNSWPKQEIAVARDGNYRFIPNARRYVKITGIFGYGDGQRETPYDATVIEGTITDSALALTVSAEGTIQAGHTILVGTEQMFVSAVTSDASNLATVERGVNGTTAAAHTDAIISVYQWPKSIEKTAQHMAATIFRGQGREGLKSERIGDYSYVAADIRGEIDTLMTRTIGAFRA